MKNHLHKIKIILTLVVIVIAAYFLIVDNKKAVQLGQTMKLDQLTPTNDAYASILRLSENSGQIDSSNIKKLRGYYQLVTERFPMMADAQGMVGFIFSVQGDVDKAQSSYKKALERNSSFFWFYFNLGMLNYKQQDFNKAAEYFEQALSLKPQFSLEFILGSTRIYLPVLYQIESKCLMVDCSLGMIDKEKLIAYLTNQLEVGYKDALSLLILSRRSLSPETLSSVHPPEPPLILRPY